MKKYVYILLVFFWIIPAGFSQLKIYSFEEAEKLAKENPKPFVIFIHTSWCNYCKMMEQSTFKNPAIITLLNTDFYFIVLDAESKDAIFFNKQWFRFKPNGQKTGIHELATALATMNSRITYPTVTVLQSDFSIVFQRRSLISSKAMLTILEKIK